ncbi:MAG: hypothetical protein WD294_14915 [Phycisphaeraceae bacterium]
MQCSLLAEVAENVDPGSTKRCASLAAIRDQKLYRAGYKTFEAYCEKRWGFKRAQAYRLIESAEVFENVSPGRQNGPEFEKHARPLASLPKDQQADGDAILYSVGANADHGLRRTNADKRASVETLLADDEWAKWSDREIAKRCAVHHDTVNRLRKETSLSDSDSERTYTDRHGNTSTMNTALRPKCMAYTIHL